MEDSGAEVKRRPLVPKVPSSVDSRYERVLTLDFFHTNGASSGFKFTGSRSIVIDIS